MAFLKNKLMGIKLIVDCWKKHFGLRTLGGGYLRYILVFADSKVYVFKTSQVSNILPWEYFAPDTSFAGDLISTVFWGSIFGKIHEKYDLKILDEEFKFFEKLSKKFKDKRLEEFIDYLEELKEKFKIDIRLDKVEDLNKAKPRVEKDCLILKLKGKETKFYFYKWDKVKERLKNFV